MLYFYLIWFDSYWYIQMFVTYILYIFGGRSINLNAGRAHIICHGLGHHHSTSLTLKPRAALRLRATRSSWFWHQGQPTSDCEERIARTYWFHPSRSCPHLRFVVGVRFVRVIAIVPWLFEEQQSLGRWPTWHWNFASSSRVTESMSRV